MIVDKGELGQGISFVQIGGSGPLVIILEGLRVDHEPLKGVNLEGFRETFKLWAKDYRIVHVSRPRGLKEGTTIPGMSSILAQELSSKYPNGFHLVGTGTGGCIALHMAADNPGIVKSLTLHSCGPKLSSTGQAIYQELLDLSSLGDWTGIHKHLAKLMFNSPFGKFLGGLTAGLFSQDLGSPDSALDFQITLLAELAQDARPLAEFINQPVLAFLGGKDPLYDGQTAQEFYASMSCGRIELFKNVPHGVAKWEHLGIWEKTFKAISAAGENANG